MKRIKSRASRNLKALGLSLAAVLALGVVGASAAQAEGKFIAGKYPASLIGSSTSAQTITIAGGVRKVSCGTASFTGELTAAAESVQIFPTYLMCSGSLPSEPVTLSPNGCSNTWTVTKLESATTAIGTEAINCPAGQEYQIDFYASAKEQSEHKPICTYGLPAQAGLGIVEYTDVGSGSTASLNITRNVTGVKVNVLKGLKIACGAAAGTSTTAAIGGSLNMTAKNAGVQTGLSVG